MKTGHNGSASRLAHLIGSWCYDARLTIDSRGATWWRQFSQLVGRQSQRRNFGLVRLLKKLPVARKHLARFHQAAANHAADHGYQGICCGHVHEIVDEVFITGSGQAIHYLNSGDWCGQTTALELNQGIWSIIDATRLPTNDEPTDLVHCRFRARCLVGAQIDPLK